jgi:hypothetical protein
MKPATYQRHFEGTGIARHSGWREFRGLCIYGKFAGKNCSTFTLAIAMITRPAVQTVILSVVAFLRAYAGAAGRRQS